MSDNKRGTTESSVIQQAKKAKTSASTEESDFSTLLPTGWKKLITGWLADDATNFDIGGFVVGDKMEEAHLYGKTKGILAGVPFFQAVFDELGCKVEWLAGEGASVDPSTSPKGKVVVAKVRGPANKLLLGERTALNILSRASGVATETHKSVLVARQNGWSGEVAATRKITPGFRLIEKYAVLVGGGSTHRMDLSHMVMLKDNHIWSAGSITAAVDKARKAAGFSSKIEVEASTFDDADEAARAGAEVVMLDNFQPAELKEVAARLKSIHPHVTLEASGGITKETIANYFCPDIDVISQGRLTHGYSCLDFSLKLQPNSDFSKQNA